jgi:hypothetical protein
MTRTQSVKLQMMSAAIVGATLVIAQCGGSTTPTTTTTTTPPSPSVSGVVLTPASATAGASVQGTVNLTAAAPATGATVALVSSNPAVVTVPGTATVAAGALTASFTATAVGAGTATITASLSGTQSTATLTVTPAVPIARFVVTGTSGADTCRLTNSGNNFDCSFNGSASTASNASQQIVEWKWVYKVQNEKTETSILSTLNPQPGCDLIPPVPAPPAPTPTQFLMTVRLTVRDTLGLVSAETVNTNVMVVPTGACGF